jgi:hypothetical protein
MPDADQIKTTVVLPGDLLARVKERAQAESTDMRRVLIGALEVYLSVELKDIEAWTVERYNKLYGDGSTRTRPPVVDSARTLEAWLHEYRRAAVPEGKKGRK